LGGFINGLNREFDEIELSMVDLRVTMPSSEVNNLIKMAQVSSSDIQKKGAGNIPDFEYNEAKVVVEWKGYIYILYITYIIYIILIIVDMNVSK